MRRLTLLLVGGAVWLFLAAVPVLADGGPHIASLNSGTGGLTADTCAGCHRAHTAQGEYLLNQPSEEALCLSCHGTAGNGATTDVLTGVQYTPTGRATETTAGVTYASHPSSTTTTLTSSLSVVKGQTLKLTGLTGLTPTGIYVVEVVGSGTFTVDGYLSGSGVVHVTSQADSVLLGALRDGGFLKARIDTSGGMRVQYIRGYENGPYNTIYAISTRPKIGVASSAQTTTSAHIDVGGALTMTETVWGNGSSGVGKTGAELACAECHNPHGNGNYRILDPVPGSDADPLGQQVSVAVKAVYPLSDTIVTSTQHGLVVDDLVTLAGITGIANGPYYVFAVTNGFTFQVAAAVTDTSAKDLTVGSDAGTVTRGTTDDPGIKVADYPVDPDSDGVYETKNYTILQTKGVQGVAGSFLLYAQDVLDALAGNGIAANQSAKTVTKYVVDGTTSYLQTSVATGVAAGDLVTISGLDDEGGANAIASGTYTVSGVRSSGTLYDQVALVGVSGLTNNQTVTGSVVRQGVPGNYSATSGDYFRRTVPWNPALVNPNCNNSIYSTNNSTYCSTMNDAPNGRPGTITAGAGKPTALVGQQAFLDQMSTWCSACHTRYYSNTNQNTGSLAPTSTVDAYVKADGTTEKISGYKLTSTGSTFGLPSIGDRVTFSGWTNGNSFLNTGEWWVVNTGGSSSSAWFQVSSTSTGDPADLATQSATGDVGTLAGPKVVRVYQSSASSWGYPRAVGTGFDETYKYQHSTASNRACTVCHVAHGSNAAMTGQYSSAYTYPNGTESSSSRLLKVDNRGTCQMCHEPTGEISAGTTVNPASRPLLVP